MSAVEKRKEVSPSGPLGFGSQYLWQASAEEVDMAMPPGRYAVKFNIAERDKQLFLAAGAAGDAAIYTDSFAAIHIIRKVILRVGSYLNYLIPKLH